jgi:hypothetical protein
MGLFHFLCGSKDAAELFGHKESDDHFGRPPPTAFQTFAEFVIDYIKAYPENLESEVVLQSSFEDYLTEADKKVIGWTGYAAREYDPERNMIVYWLYGKNYTAFWFMTNNQIEYGGVHTKDRSETLWEETRLREKQSRYPSYDLSPEEKETIRRNFLLTDMSGAADEILANRAKAVKQARDDAAIKKMRVAFANF